MADLSNRCQLLKVCLTERALESAGESLAVRLIHKIGKISESFLAGLQIDREPVSENPRCIMDRISLENFGKCLGEIVRISDYMIDGWKMNIKEGVENGQFLTKTNSRVLNDSSDDDAKILATIEYHVAYHISYGVPVLCFNIWKQDGTFLTVEDYWKYNENLKQSNLYDTLTQMDHPVLCKPFITLHPCRTEEIMQPFLENSKNPVISWLSVVGPFVHLNILEEYLKHC
ncbi:hypothetical protein JTB14_002609 [Gonioctena quinquepunctata]|nr:hypothetical protein JTB14_002609 [Gonioctena quinquepunctata]